MPQPRRIHRAPADSGSRLLDPPLVAAAGHGSIEDLVDNNRLLRAAFDTRIGDLKLWELVAATRREMLTVAVEYTAAYRDARRPDDVAGWIARPIIMGGHQPELFHAGVWLKNAALDAYARRVGGTAINLIVDSDRCQGTTAPVPVGTPRAARLEHVPFDVAAPEMPWEERGVVDRDCFESFGNRAADLLAPLAPDCILRPWWPLVVERTHESHRLGLGIAQARHMLEERLGLESLELPVSEMVRLPTVMVFIGWLLAHAPRLHEAHNAAVAAYRREHRVRGHGRPIPELAARREAGEEWLEVPWWLWAKDEPRRRRVFASRSADGLTLSDLETVRIELPISPETSPSKWVDALSRIEEHQLRLRPRAVVTTLIARLLVADVFVHGIGGAAYDRITDDLVRRLTGCDPPRHAVVSGTLRLPVEQLFPGFESDDPEAKLAAVQAGIRDLEFHPERHLEPLASQPEVVQELLTEKWRWINTHPTTALARRRCREIRAANARLAVHTQPLRDELLGRVGPLAAAIRGRKALASREFPWCFFPEKTLKTFLTLETV
jgi:hypothetical protein